MFEKDVMSPLKEKYAFGKSISRDFIYTGIHFLQNDDNEIYIDQDEFVDKLETFEYHGKDNDKYINKHENKLIWKSVGQLSWASTQTRPDVAYNALKLSMYINRAKLIHAKKLIKPLKRQNQKVGQ